MRFSLYAFIVAFVTLLVAACSGVAPVEQSLACAQVELNPVNGGASNAVSATYPSREARDLCLGDQRGGGPDDDDDD